MKLLCISNGHGEDTIAVQVLKELRRLPEAPVVAALPLVGEGWAFQKAGIPIVGPTQTLPSGGFLYMDGRQLARDVAGGLLSLSRAQLQTVRQWSQSGDGVLAVGDIVPLGFAWWSGLPYSFIGTAKSEYFLQDESGPLPERPWFEGWSGSVYLPWERWLMGHPRCQTVFVRDQLTTRVLSQRQIPAVYAGNPMMDHLDPNPDRLARLQANLPQAEKRLTLVLLPGSRAPEAMENWQLILRAVETVLSGFPDRQVQLLGAIAPSLNLAAFREALEEAGWQARAADCPAYHRNNGVLLLPPQAFAECLYLADAAIATAGTATEQVVGLGKPVFTFPGKGPQFTAAFAAVQARLLGDSVITVAQPEAVGAALQDCLQSPQRLQAIATNGKHRMGPPGAAQRMAAILHKTYSRLSTRG